MTKNGNNKNYVKIITAVFMSFCMLMSMIPIAHAASVKLSELPAGTIITIGGHSWNVLDPAKGYLQSYHHVGDACVFDPDNTNRYNPADTNNIAYYLNNTFYNSLTAEGQGMILNHTWSTGDQSNENASSVTCKVGVIGKSEFTTYEPYMSHVVTAYFWSRTPFSGNTSELYVFNPDMVDNEKKAATAWSYMVPTVYISPDTVITDTMRNHTVTASMNNTSWGSVSFNGKFEIGKTVQETFAEGATVTVTAVPLPGYQVASWTLNGTPVSNASNTFTFTNGSTDASVVANFEAVKYQVTVNTGYNDRNRGSVTGSGQYANGQNVTIRAIPNPGYRLKEWFYEDSLGAWSKRYVTWPATYTFAVEAKNYTLTAYFEEDPNSNLRLVELYPLYGGTASGGGMKPIGSNIVLTAVPDDGYRFTGWQLNGIGPLIPDAVYTYTVPSTSVWLRANFAYIPLKLATSNPTEGERSKAYHYKFMSEGGDGPKTFAVTAGTLPAGLSLAADGTLSGTPTTIGTNTFTVTVSAQDDEYDRVSDSKEFTMNIHEERLAINKSNPANGTVGTAYTHSFTATNGTGTKTYAVTAGTLPAGLTLAADGTLSGTPSAIETSTFTVTVTDSASTPASDSNAYSITIAPESLVINKAYPASVVVETPYSHSFTATGGTGAKSFAVTAGTLPAGLSLAADGTLSGTPSAIETSTFTVTVTDSATPAVTDSNAYTMTINPSPLAIYINNPVSGTVGSAYSHSFMSIGGTGTKTFAVAAGTLPAGLSLAPDGILSGTPSAIETSTFTVTVTDSATPAVTDSNAYTMTINPAPLVINRSNPASGTAESAYSHSFSATGGTGTKTFAVTAGTLPAGLSLAADGTLSGTPSDIGISTFTVTVTDSATPAVTDSNAYTMTMNPAPLVINKSNPASGTVGSVLSHSFTATGGTGTKTFTVSAGTLPTGLSLAADGTLSGTPSAIETSTFTVTVTDSATPAVTDSNAYTMTINSAPLVINKSNPARGTTGSTYSHSFTATGGTGTKTFAVTAGTLPAGLSLASDGTLSGTPSAIKTSTFTVTVTDSATPAVTDSNNYTMIIADKSTSNGGGGGGGGSSTPTTNEPKTTKTNTETSSPSITSTTTTEAKSDSSGKASAAVTESQVKEAVRKAAEEAAKQGEGTETKLEIKVTAPAEAKTVEASIPKAAFAAVADSKTDVLTATSTVATITFDKAAITTISKEATADVKISASKVDVSDLSEATKEAVGDRPVFNFSVTSGDKTISQFGGTVTVSVPYTPKAGEDSNAIVIYYINAQGKPEMVKDCIYDKETGMIAFTTNHFSKYAVGYNKVSFKDVASTAWYSDAISFVAARGITTGTGDGKFNPEETLTRGQFLVMLMRAYGIEPDSALNDNFTDAGNMYYTGYLATAKKLGITAGIGNNLFAPDKEITRQEMFTLLYNTLKKIGELPADTSGKTLSSFADASDIASWAKDAMTLFVKTGTASGNGGNLNPTATANRAEMVQVLYNLLSN